MFLISLSQPAMHLDGSTTDQPGECLLLLCIGWIGVFGYVYAWLANPFLLAAWISMIKRCNGRAAVFSIVSLGFALSFLWVRRWDRDESGSHPATITGHGLGYWLWIASISTALLGSILATVLDQPDPEGRASSADYRT